ncbi:MAG: glycosyltransferase family 2 protein [Chloroflexi bacterium]|nr:glycosyltransferase family 2 protein [Chloroflexota bacterium]
MSTLPLISIVTPSFNQAEYLSACMASVLGQDYPRLEYLVLDGGSTDGSRDVIQRHATRLAFWASEADRGQASAVNKGWARARGEILGWLNSDDRLAPGALEHVARIYQSHPDAAMIFGDIQEVDSLERPVHLKHMANFDVRTLLLGKNMGQPGVFITRRCYAALGGLDETLHYALDFEYFVRAWLAFPVAEMQYSESVLAFSRLWGGTKSARDASRFGEEYRLVLDRVFARADLTPQLVNLRRRAYSRAVEFRQARLHFESRRTTDARRWLLRAAWHEPQPVEKLRMLWFGARYLMGLHVPPAKD